LYIAVLNLESKNFYPNPDGLIANHGLYESECPHLVSVLAIYRYFRGFIPNIALTAVTATSKQIHEIVSDL